MCPQRKQHFCKCVSVINFYFFFALKVWPDMTLMLKHWKIIVLISVVLFVMTSPCPPFTLKCNTWEGTSVFTQTLMAHCGSSVTNVTHLFTLNVPLRNLKIVLRVRDLFVHFFAADNSKVQLLDLIYPPFFCLLISFLCSFISNMGRNKICPDGDERKEESGGSSYKNMKLNQWPAGI